jgi:hypothetical protein
MYGLKAVHAESKLDFERLANELPKRDAMVEQRKTAKGTAQKIGNPPKHPFGKGTASNPKGRPRGSKNLSTYLEAARDQVFATAGGRSPTISELQATAMSSLWL